MIKQARLKIREEERLENEERNRLLLMQRENLEKMRYQFSNNSSSKNSTKNINESNIETNQGFNKRKQGSRRAIVIISTRAKVIIWFSPKEKCKNNLIIIIFFFYIAQNYYKQFWSKK